MISIHAIKSISESAILWNRVLENRKRIKRATNQFHECQKSITTDVLKMEVENGNVDFYA